MKYSDALVVITFKSRGRLFVEIPVEIEQRARIVAGEPMTLKVVGEDIIYKKLAGAASPQQQWQEGHASQAGFYQEPALGSSAP